MIARRAMPRRLPSEPRKAGYLPRERPAPRMPNAASNTQVLCTTDEVEFIMAMDRYKREKCRPFPTWREVLAVLVSLGYKKESPS